MINIKYGREEIIMEISNQVTAETSWQDLNTADCDESSLFDMCSWAEAN